MSGYHLYQSNRLNKLLLSHLDVFSPNDPLNLSSVIVLRDKAMRTWFSLQVSKINGVAFNLPFKNPIELALQIIGDFEKKEKLIFDDDLYFLVIKEIEIMEKEKNLFSSYLSSNKDLLSREKRRSFLAREISKQLYDYSSKGEAFLGQIKSSPNELYRLQYRIYESIFIKQGYRELYSCLREIQKENKPYPGELKEIHLFGSAFISAPFQDFFNFMSRFINIHHFQWILSKQFFYPYQTLPNRLMQKWSGPLQESLLLLGKNESLVVKEQNLTPYDEESATTLSKIKEALMNKSLSQKKDLVFDDSFQILCAPTLKRELEIIKDKMTSLLDKDLTLKLNDILVLSPDISPYSPFIEEVFSKAESPLEENPLRIPYNLIDVEEKNSSKLKQGFFSLLNLVYSRFEVDKILVLFNNPYFLKANDFNREDFELFHSLLKNYKIKWAVNKEHKTFLELGDSPYFTYENAFEAIYESMIFSEESSLRFGSARKKALSSWIETLDKVYSDTKALRKARKSIKDWASHLSKLLEKYFASPYFSEEEKKEFVSVRSIIRELYQTDKDLHLKENPLYKNHYSLSEILDSITNNSSPKRKKGHYSATGVTFSSLVPFRSHPAKIIFIIGLNDDPFLNDANPSPLDFQKEFPNETRQNEERQFAFLEAMYSAEEKIFLSALNYDWKKKEEKEFSSIVWELLYFLSQTFSLPQITKKAEEAVPVKKFLDFLAQKGAFYSFDKQHFSPSSKLPSYDATAFTLLNAIENPIKEESKNQLPKPLEVNRKVSFENLKRFLRDPAQIYMNKTLNVFIESDEAPMDAEESLDMGNLEKNAMKRDFLEKIDFSSTDAEIFERDVSILFSTFKEGKIPPFIKDQMDEEKEKLMKLASSLQTFLNKYDYYLSKSIPESVDFQIEDALIENVKLWPLYQSSTQKSSYLFIISGDSIGGLTDAYVHTLCLFHLPLLKIQRLTCIFFGKNELHQIILEKKNSFEENLKHLLLLYFNNLSHPILLYPDLATDLCKLMKKKDSSAEILSQEIKKHFTESSSYGKKMFDYHSYAPFFIKDSFERPFQLTFDGDVKKLMEKVYIPIDEYFGLNKRLWRTL